MIKVDSRVNLLFIFFLHLSFLLSCFEFYLAYKLHYFTFLLMFIWVFLTSSFVVKKAAFIIGFIIIIFNSFSQLAGIHAIGKWDFSWSLQIMMFGFLIIFLPASIAKIPLVKHQRICKFFLIILSVIMLLASIYVLFLIGLNNIFEQKSSYTRLALITSTFGLIKFIIPLLSLALYFIAEESMVAREKMLCICSFFLFMAVVLVKTIILSLLIGISIYLIRCIKTLAFRRILNSILTFAFILLLFIFYDYVSLLGVLNGRYILPIITSSDFFNYPFGFGYGNYSDVMSSMLIQLNYSGEYNDDLVRFLGLRYGEAFSTSESDILQFGISFGFIFLFFYFLYIIYILIRLLEDEHLSMPMLAVLMLLTSGFYQDYSQNAIYWLMFSYFLGLTFLVKKRS